jgi:hypothetical protein
MPGGWHAAVRGRFALIRDRRCSAFGRIIQLCRKKYERGYFGERRKEAPGPSW